MKRVMVILGVLISVTVITIVFGQTADGVITYEVKVNLHRRIPAEREGVKAMIPEFRTTKEQLFFNDQQSYYKPLIEDDEESMTSTVHSGGGVHIRMQQANTEIFLDQTSQLVVAKQEFMGKDYLIEDTLTVSPWRFGPETKSILGYECKQAYYTDTSRPDQKMEVTAWFTDRIRPFLGPERFHSLPGAVLAVDINNGERVIVARQLELRPLKKNEIKRPSVGQKMSLAEFRKMVDEQTRQMGTRGGVIIRN